MKAVVWDSYNHVYFEPDYPEPVCKDDWVIVKVMSAGICATDLHIIKGEFGEAPLIPGHEICGIITEVGKNVVSSRVGDRVVIETAVSCGHCPACESGNKHLCPECHEIGFPPHNGGYAQYVTAPANCIHKIPDNMSYDEGGILEAALCPFGLVYRLGMKPAETVLIQGTGVAGLSFIQSVKCFSAKKIIVAARNEYRLEQAKRFGADVIINVKKEDLEKRVMEETDGLGVDLSIDAAGKANTIDMAIRLTAPGGKCILYGLPDGDEKIPVPVKEIIMKQITVMGGTNNQMAWDPLIDLISKGYFNVKDYVTGVTTLEEAENGLKLTEEHPDEFIKMVIHPWD